MLKNRKASPYVVCTTVAFLAACGGGDDGASTGGQTSPPPAAGNSAPVIQGQPGTSVLVGQTYAFQPSASDADRDALTFSIANLPGWASFDATSGRLTGRPSPSDLGTYSNIQITVTDGRATSALTPFSVVVTETGSGVAVLSWTPPTQNSDGSALVDLAGYEILYGRDADALTQSSSISNPSISTYVVENLTSGVWYFAVIAVNSRGVGSPLSNVTNKTIT